MNKNAMKELKKQFIQGLHSVNQVKADADNDTDTAEQSSYWSAIGEDFSNVVDAEREHLLYR